VFLWFSLGFGSILYSQLLSHKLCRLWLQELEDGTRPRLPGANLDAITSGGHLGSPGLTPLALALKWGRVAMVKLIREKDGSGGIRGGYQEQGFYQADTSWMTKNSRADTWEAGEEDPNAFKAFTAKPKPAEKGLKLKMAFGGVASYLKAKEHAEEEHDKEGSGGGDGAGADGEDAHNDGIDDQALWAAAGDEARAKVQALLTLCQYKWCMATSKFPLILPASNKLLSNHLPFFFVLVFVLCCNCLLAGR